MRASNTEASNLSADILLIFRLYGIHIILALPYHISKQQQKTTKTQKFIAQCRRLIITVYI